MNYKTLQNILINEFTTSTGGFNAKKLLPADILAALHLATNFLNYNAPNKVRYSYVVNGITEQKQCIECNIFIQHTNGVLKTTDFCSLKCSRKSNRTKQRRADTNLSKYGISNAFLDKRRIQQLIKEKYNVDNISQLDSTKKKISIANTNNAYSRLEKSKETNLQKYGTQWYSTTDEFKDKIQQTSLKKFGTISPFSNNDVKSKIKKTNIARYGVENPSKSKQIINKIAGTKQDRYGSSTFNNRHKAANTMDELYGTHYSKVHWTPDTLILMSDKESLIEIMKGNTINFIADQIGIAPTTLRNRLYELDIIDYNKRTNIYETFIEDILLDTGIEFIRNDRNILNGKELDFVIPSLNVAIEVNGIFWHSELMGKGKQYHLNKTLQCKDAGIKLIHIWDYQIDTVPDVIKSTIYHVLKQTKISIGARETTLVNLSPDIYRRFLASNHIQQEMNSSIRIGLEYNDELISVMGFGKSRFNSVEYELHRFATKNNVSVPGAASKLFKNFLAGFNGNSIISYANGDFSTGNLYDVLGFTQVSSFTPTYYYFKGRNVFHRMHFQKHKLIGKLANFNPTLSGWANMQQAGFNRFWTTGNLKYEYTK